MAGPRRRAFLVIIPLIVGITGLMTVLARPRASAYATVDILELVAGMCFGIAIVAVAQTLRGNRPG